MKLLLTLTLLATGLASSYGYRSYSNYVVVRSTPQTKEQLAHLRNMYENDLLTFWREPRRLNETVDMMILKSEVERLSENFRSMKINSFVLHKDIDRLVQDTLPPKNNRGMDWESYHRLDDVHQYMRDLSVKYPKLCTLKNMGKSFEGRDMLMLIVENKKATKPKRGVMIDGGIHAREWISVAVVSHFLKDFIENYSEYSTLLDNYILHIIPSINPDGYEYSHTKERIWRKTRSSHPTLICKGADPNRNFDFFWGGLGTSGNSCSDVFRGINPLSEPEMKIIADHLESNDFLLYLTFHSYSQMILFPWGYDEVYTEDYEDLNELAAVGSKAMFEATGVEYEYGVSSMLLNAAAGGSDDYAKAKGGVKYSYTVELRDTGYYGFLLPPEQILPTVEEARAMVLAMLKKLLET